VGIQVAIALLAVQHLVPDGVLTPEGEAWVAGGVAAVLAVVWNWAKHRFGRDGGMTDREQGGV
jgi:hypothetical protein